jgi:SAM-dependent MidA family methyltransferase
MGEGQSASLSVQLQQRIGAAIAGHGGWLAFDRFMALALYEPGLGYYAHGSRKFGAMPGSGSDFVTAPELSPLFGRALAVQVAQAQLACASGEIWEFGAGSGALAAQLLAELGDRVDAYHVIELSAGLRERQVQCLQPWAGRVQWHDRLPKRIDGVVLGNEVLDAMPVQLLHWDGGQWFERGVAAAGDAFVWTDRPTHLRPPASHFVPGTVVEIHPQAEAFVRTLAAHLGRSAAFFIDYGFPEAEYYHPQRVGGTLMCHRAHLADADPLSEVGLKDITSHVNFSGIALTAQEAGLEVLGYTSQAHFLINCGLPGLIQGAALPERVAAQRLINEHEMGELFKVVCLARGIRLDPLGFASGDRSHRL